MRQFRRWLIAWLLTWLTWLLVIGWQGTWRALGTCLCVAVLTTLYLDHRWPDEPGEPDAG